MTFICPRCLEPSESEFYGPCGTCTSELIAAQFSIPNKFTRKTMSEGVEYVPKMNVTPNAVATKDEW